MAGYTPPPLPKAPAPPKAAALFSYTHPINVLSGQHAGGGPFDTAAHAVPGAAPHPAAAPKAYVPPAPAPPPAPNPYDSTYYQQLGNATLAAGQKINGYNLQNANAGTNLDATLGNDQYNNTLAIQKAQDAENARGGFALGHLGETMGNVNRSYLDQESAAARSEGQANAMRDAAIAGVQSNLSTDQIALAIQAADRSSALAAKNPAVGGVVPPAPPSATKGGILARPGAKAPPAVPGYTVRGLGGGNWEYLPAGLSAPRGGNAKSAPRAPAPKGLTQYGNRPFAPAF